MKNTWNTINSAIRKSNLRKHKYPNCFNINGKLTNDRIYIINKFNEYFIGIGQTVANNINPDKF